MKDEELVDKACSGNVDAYAALVRKYANAVYAVTINIVRDVHAAEDISQEVFLNAWLNMNKLKDRNKIGNWLCTIAKHRSIDWIKKNAKEISLSGNSGVLCNTTTLENIVEQRENKEMVREAIYSLKDIYKEVTLLYFMSDFNAREISEFLDLSVSAVESRLRRAKQQLKKELLDLAQEMLTNQKLGENFHQEVIKRITGLAAINLPVSNAEVSTEWYVSHLGCTLIREPQQFSNEKNAMIKLGNGPTVLLHEEEDSVDLHFMRKGKPAPIFELQTDDIEGFYKQLKKEGVTVTERYDNLPCGKYFQAEDPDGNMITIVEL